MESLILKLNGYEYVLTENVDKGYVRADVLNEALNGARIFLSRIRATHKHPDLNCKLYVYEAQDINAFATTYAGQHVIAISVGGMVQLNSWFELWTKSKDICKEFEIDDDHEERLAEILFQNAINFLVAHEYYHIINGHCDLPETEEHFLYERSNATVSKEHSIFLQCLEYDADCCATAACINQLLLIAGRENVYEELLIRLVKNKSNIATEKAFDAKVLLHSVTEEVLILRLKLLYFAIYGIFKLFSEEEQTSFEEFIKDDLYKYDHPHAGIRMEYVGRIMITVLERIVGSEKAVEYWEKIAQWIIRICIHKSKR